MKHGIDIIGTAFKSGGGDPSVFQALKESRRDRRLSASAAGTGDNDSAPGQGDSFCPTIRIRRFRSLSVFFTHGSFSSSIPLFHFCMFKIFSFSVFSVLPGSSRVSHAFRPLCFSRRRADLMRRLLTAFLISAFAFLLAFHSLRTAQFCTFQKRCL